MFLRILYLFVGIFYGSNVFSCDRLWMDSGYFCYGEDEDYSKNQFFYNLYHYNQTAAEEIRNETAETEQGNRLKVKLFAFYETDNYRNYTEHEIPLCFISGWRDRNLDSQKFFSLGDAYSHYVDFNNSSKNLSKIGLKKLVQDSPGSFVETLIGDFRQRGLKIDEFSTRQNDPNKQLVGPIFNHQNYSHSEQAFFSYVYHKSNSSFIYSDIPKSLLVNMVSYHPPCEYCYRSINTLLSDDLNIFKERFITRIFPNIVGSDNFTTDQLENDDPLIKNSISSIKTHVLFSSADINPTQSFDVFTQNPTFINSRF